MLAGTFQSSVKYMPSEEELKCARLEDTMQFPLDKMIDLFLAQDTVGRYNITTEPFH